MEIRQLEYFVTSVEEKSFYKASEKLFTSQPAISKAIKLLEKDVNSKLFDRTSKGIKLTANGEKLYHYAKNILRQVDIMKKPSIDDDYFLRVASYPSKTVSDALAEFFYKHKKEVHSNCDECTLQLDYREGTVQDIMGFVDSGISEIGIVYISPNQEKSFNHILSHKNLEFIPIKQSELCVYVGKKHSLYGSKKKLAIDEISKFKYIRGVKDFFSVEHHFDYVSLNDINTSRFDDIIVTNSDHFTSSVLEKTDICYLGIDTVVENENFKIKINANEKNLTLGYIKTKVSEISQTTMEFLAEYEKHITFGYIFS